MTMAVLRMDEIARTTGGRILQGSPALDFDHYGIDSRQTRTGELFFAIVDKRDGHDYVIRAAEKGAAGAVVARPLSVPNEAFGLVQVEDTLCALQELARGVLQRQSAKVVAITGSIGKTTTKEFTAALLSPRFRVLKSMANFNNHLGLALSLLRIVPSDEVAVLEMGMSAAGEIRRLAQIAPPDVAVITNIQPVHLQFFKSVDAIALAKREILEGVKKEGIAVLNGSDPLVRKIASDWKGRKIFFGWDPECDVCARNVRLQGLDGLEFLLKYGEESAHVLFPFHNRTYVLNVLAACAVASALGLSIENVLPGIAKLKPFTMRGELIKLPNGVLVYDDSYNSNPHALDEALKSLGNLFAHRRIAVLGDMLELGRNERDFHREAGKAVVRWKWNVLVAVGPLAGYMAEAAAAEGMPEETIYTWPDSRAAAERIGDIVRPGDLVLIKGSRGMKMERIVEKMRSEKEE